MRWLGYWAAVIAGAATTVSGCLTSQENPGGEGRLEDPPITIERGGSGGSAQGAEGGEPSGGSNSRGGRSGAGGGSGTSQGGSDAGCTADRDCALRVDGRSRCYVATGECVDCLNTADCGGNECVNNECKVVTTCATTDDCPLGLVCNPSTDLCVECVVSTDCNADEACISNVCRKRCTAENACALFGLHCDRGRGYCVECADDDDCAPTRNCQQGTCVRDICVPNTGSCEGTVPNTYITTCNEAGSVLSTGVPCDPQTTCVEEDGQAHCEDWVCTPGDMGCSISSERIVECSEDGLEETVVEDCEANDQLCVDSVDMCMSVVCEPNARFCQGTTVQLCDSTGSTSSLVDTCETNEYCNTMTATCTPLLCTPNQPVCDGNFFTTCNSTGTGYTGTRTDCTMMGQFCGVMGCQTGAIDTIPPMPVLYSSGMALANYTMVNIYSVSSSRTLSRIEQYMSPVSATPLNWVVYESTSATGTFTRLSLTMTTTSTTGAGYQASGDLAVPLVAGRYYAIGVAWANPATGFGYQQTTPTGMVSFGSLISAYLTATGTPPTSFTGPSPSTYWFGQRLTTAP